MIEHNTEITTADGVMATFITHPETNGPHPVILFLMDAPGKREELHDMARRISATGYYVMLPNLYYRDVPSFTVHRDCLLYTSPITRDATLSRMPASA